MTKKKAKELSLEIWQYLKDHPEIDNKVSFPIELAVKLDDMIHSCPLCELYHKNGSSNESYQKKCSKKCPLSDEQCEEGSLYVRWCFANTDRTRKKYATLIYNKILTWDIKGVKKNEIKN